MFSVLGSVKRRLLLTALLATTAACGRSDDPRDDLDPGKLPSAGSCLTGCKRGFKCSLASCVLDPYSLWIPTVTSGKVASKKASGDAWDTLGGAPDPYVCLTIGSRRSCTTTVKDSFQPYWNEAFPAATALTLMDGVTVSIVDEDLANNDGICGPNVVPVTQPSFQTGQWSLSCDEGSFTVTLTPQ